MFKRPVLLITAMFGLLSILQAQKAKGDSLFVLREYMRIWQIYKEPVQLTIHIQNTADPISKETDTISTDVEYYLSSHEFYFQAEGLEQIVNDSMIIVVNHSVKQISIYRNERSVKTSIDKAVGAFLPDSTLERLSQTYLCLLKKQESNKNRIELLSRATVFGTNYPRERIEVLYKQNEYLPIELLQAKCSLIPIDSLTYAALLNEQNYNGKLVSSKTEKGNWFFILKELKTLYNFKKIKVNVPRSPVQQQDRILKDENGIYVAVEKYKDYMVAVEF